MRVGLVLYLLLAANVFAQDLSLGEPPNKLEKDELRRAAKAMLAKDYRLAVQIFHVYAEKGAAWAQFRLGVRYMRGEGVEENKPLALAWFLKAAEQGVAYAQHDIGIIYSTGDGVPQDDAEALKWFRKAAALGLPDSENLIGWAYANGRGVEIGYSEARNWFSKAAEDNHPEAQVSLGMMYCNGQAVAQDIVKCLMWLMIAEANESEPAKKLLTRARNWANTEQIAKAKKAAEDWQEALRTPQ